MRNIHNLILCVDIGGTHITSACLDKDSMLLIDGSLRHQLVNSQGDEERILSDWDNALSATLDSVEGSIDAMFVSIPGPFDYDNGICLMDGMHKYQSLLHMDIKAYFASHYHISSERIFFFNDAHAFLLGEVYHYGWSKRRIVGLTLGTGLGSALYDDMTPKDLNFGSADFRSGIVEDYISTRGIVRFLAEHTGRTFAHIKQLVDDTNAGKEQDAAFSFLTTALIDFIEMYIVPLNPDIIVLGGSIAKANHLFLKNLQDVIAIPIIVASMDEVNLFYGMASTKEFRNQS